MNKDKVEKLIAELLKEIGEDAQREGLIKTPSRVASTWELLTKGYTQSLKEIVNGALFTSVCDSMVVVKDIELYSMCEHHLLPFFGKCHIGYIPDGKVLGISKFARIVDMYARRLQIQEQLTEEIARAIVDVLHPVGIGVVIEAKHLCMMMRGVEKQNSIMVTSSVLGQFRQKPATRGEFLSMIGKR